MDNLIEKAGRTIVETCSRLMPSETAVIVTDRETLEIGETIRAFAEKIAKKVTLHVLEDYAERPLTFIPEEISEDVKQSEVMYYCARSKQGELQKFRSPLVKLAIASGRDIHMPGIEDRIMRSGMQADYYKIASLTYKIMSVAAKSKTARVTTPTGTDIQVEFSNRLKWVPDTGLLWYRGMFGNLPAGEAYTCPVNMEGLMVVDGVLGDFLNQKYGNLEDTPVHIPVQNSRAQVDKITCENGELLQDLKEYLTQDENASRVGEFAVGTNTSLKTLIGNMLQDEKFPGVHVAFGYPYPQDTGADWESKGHLDGIMKRCSIQFDTTQVMEDGTFIMEEL